MFLDIVHMMHCRINRNILECKSLLWPVLWAWFSVLIETYWNVNDRPRLSILLQISINRNILECKCITKLGSITSGIVLIETYWNVNVLLPYRLTVRILCINRNILECKFMYVLLIDVVSSCINRNILECKLITLRRKTGSLSTY